MWIPKNELEIIHALQSKSLEETSIFEAKRELPSKENNIDIAIGIAENEQRRLTIANPVTLKDQPERITSIVQTSISGPPTITINTIPTKDKADKMRESQCKRCKKCQEQNVQ